MEDLLTPKQRKKKGTKKEVKVEGTEVKELKLEKPVYLTYEDYPIEDLLTYAGIDCLVTSDLAKRLEPTLTKEPEYTYFETKKGIRRVAKIPSILDSYLEFSAPAMEFLIDLELNGFLYDVELNQQVSEQMVAEIAELEDKIFAVIGKRINLDSTAALGELLYVERGFEVLSRTKTGEPSTDGDALKGLQKAHPEPENSWLGLIAKRNDIASLYRTFVATYVKDFVKSDGRIHPSYNQHGTGSFRISGEDPNLTQLPNPKHGYNLRRFYKVPKGSLLVAADYSSAEVKILGAICKDEKLLQAIAEGKDFHSYSACEMHGLDYEEFVRILDDEGHPLRKIYKAYRQGSKALTYPSQCVLD